ncbi:MAG: 5'-methylthioadenosine phosphorylase [Salinisphaeraceae bacterium]|nr:5'-methylthioadenosine phosphorylase [Salinisphaeraceae bacterium]
MSGNAHLSPIGIIGGTALAELAGLEQAQQMHPETGFGAPSGPLVSGRFAGRDVTFLMRHGRGHAIPPHAINYRANIQALADAGVKQVIAIAAVGGIHPDMPAGSLVIPDQIIDYSWGRAHSFWEGDGAMLHVDFTQPYSESLRRSLIDAAQTLDLPVVDRGVHGVTQGPRLETAAEVDRMERDGCDIVGMTGMPEASLAREAGLEYACCAVVVNQAAGRGEAAIHAEIEHTLADGMRRVAKLLERVLGTL